MELSADTFVELVEFATTSSAQQSSLIEAIARETEGWVSASPGFVAAALHRSEDGERVVNYAQWRSRADWQRFTEDDRITRLRDAVKATGAEPRGSRSFALARTIAAPG